MIDQNRKKLSERLGAFVEFTQGVEQGKRVPLLYERTVLGRKFGDILVRDLKVSATHLAIEYHGGQFQLVDLGSSNGTFLGKQRIKTSRLEPSIPIKIGESVFEFHLNPEESQRLRSEQSHYLGAAGHGLKGLLDDDLFQGSTSSRTGTVKIGAIPKRNRPFILKILLGAESGKSFSFLQTNVVVGRSQADLVLNDPDLSRKHALFVQDDGGRVTLRDLGSTNGTYVNDHKIDSTVLKEGDRIRVGKTVLLYSREENHE